MVCLDVTTSHWMSVDDKIISSSPSFTISYIIKSTTVAAFRLLPTNISPCVYKTFLGLYDRPESPSRESMFESPLMMFRMRTWLKTVVEMCVTNLNAIYCGAAEFFQEKSSWCRNVQVCQEVKCKSIWAVRRSLYCARPIAVSFSSGRQPF